MPKSEISKEAAGVEIDLETIGYFLFMEEQEREQQKANLNSPDTEDNKEYYSNGRNN